MQLRILDEILLLLKLLQFQLLLLLHFLDGFDWLLLFLVDWRFHNFLLHRSSCAGSFELEFTIANLSTFLISCRRDNLSVSENKRDLHSLILDRLERATNVDAQFS